MKAKSFFRPAMLAIGLFIFQSGNGQVSTPNNFPNTPGSDYVGWNGGSTSNVPLMVRHNGNHPIEWYTDSIQRMGLNHTVSYAIGDFGAAPRNGFVGISGRPGLWNTINGPYSRLHLVDDVGTDVPETYAQTWGYRPWMRNGITLTGNSDQSYMGHKYDGSDRTDLVLQWSDNTGGGQYGTDRLKFIFTSGYDAGAANGSSSLNGLEAMRFWPESSSSVLVGIGDYAPIGVGDPTERLDVLSGNVRIRDLPTHLDEELDLYVVVDDDGVLHSRTLPPGTIGCEWTMNTSAPHDVYTAWNGAASGCPDENSRVGMGVNTPNSKLHVRNEVTDRSVLVEHRVPADDSRGVQVDYNLTGAAQVPGAGYGLRVDAKNAETLHGLYTTLQIDADLENVDEVRPVFGSAKVSSDAQLIVGVEGQVQSLNGIHVPDIRAGMFETLLGGNTTHDRAEGIRAIVSRPGGSNGNSAHVVGARVQALLGDSTTTGVEALAKVDQSSSICYGVYAKGEGSSGRNYGLYAWGNGVTGIPTYGVYARVNPGLNHYAGYFVGNVHVNGNVHATGSVTWSDATLKNNVEEIANSHDLLMSLNPRRYVHSDIALQRMGAFEGEQYGFIAQEVEAVLPSLVVNTVVTAEVDTNGVEIWPEMELKGVNYTAIIPLLVAGYQGQQALIEEQSTRLAQLEQALAACCAAGAPTQPNDAFDGRGQELLDPALERLLLINPNPINEQTTITYTLERTGRAQLLVNSADGRQVQVLHEGQLLAGEHRYDWSTAHLAPGVHYVTLLLDGEPLVKRAVKVR